MPYLCKKEKGNDKNFHLKKKKFLYHKFFFEIFWKKIFALNPFLGWFKAKKNFPKKFQKNFWPKKKIEFFFKLKFLIFPFSFLQRLGKNIKIYYLGFLKIITFRQYVKQFRYRNTFKKYISLSDTLYNSTLVDKKDYSSPISIHKLNA